MSENSSSQGAVAQPEAESRAPPKSPAIPQFFTEAVKLEWKSRQEGRPIFEDREFVRIIIPGDRRSMAVEPVGEPHKARWPREYEAFRAGREAPLEGTPLSEWPVSMMSPARVQELAWFNLRTVEQLAAVNDAQLQNLGMGSRELRERARTWLDVAVKGSAPIERLIARNEAMLEALREAERFLDYFANGRRSFDGGGTPRSALAQVRAAIALAEGRPPESSTDAQTTSGMQSQ